MCRIFLQETFVIYDCLFADDGISGNAIYEKTRSELQVTNTGSIITATGNYAHAFFKSQSTRFSVDFRVEFDLLESVSGVRLDINETSDNWIQLSNTGHYIINITSNGITATRDGNTITTPSLTPSNPIRLSFYISNTGQSMKFKNLKVYSI